MARTSGIFVLTSAMAALTLASCASPPQAPTVQQALYDADGEPRVGYLEHRGRQHDVRDLLDPAYRAASEDEFARDFNPNTALADRHRELPQPRFLSADVIGHAARE